MREREREGKNSQKMQSIVFWQLSAAGGHKKFHKISKHVHSLKIVRVNLFYKSKSGVHTSRMGEEEG